MCIVTTDIQLQVIETFFLIAKENPKIEKISIQSIANKMGIRRESIYKYSFRTPKEILDRVHYLIDSEIEEKLEKFSSVSNHDFTNFLSHEILPALYNRREWLRILCQSNLDPYWALHLEEKHAPTLEKYLDDIGKNEVVSNSFLSHFIVKNFHAIVATWLSNENPIPAALFQKKFLYLFSSSLGDLLFK